MSYALRVVVCFGPVPASALPRRWLVAGIASVTRIASVRATIAFGWLVTKRAQRAKAPRSDEAEAEADGFVRRRRGSVSLVMRGARLGRDAGEDGPARKT